MSWKKILLILAVVGAFTFASAPKSDAHVSVGIGIGMPDTILMVMDTRTVMVIHTRSVITRTATVHGSSFRARWSIVADTALSTTITISSPR